MKTLLTFAAAAAMTFAATEADAQSRRRAAATQAQAPLPPVAYRLIGPGAASAEAGAPAAAASPTVPAVTPTVAPARSSDVQPEAEAQTTTPPATRTDGAAPAIPATPIADAGPGTPERARAETALRRVLGELAAGSPDYALMNEETAARVRTQQPSLTPTLKQYGAIKTITPLAATGGQQRFRVEFANGAATFVIATDAEAKITALGVES